MNDTQNTPMPSKATAAALYIGNHCERGLLGLTEYVIEREKKIFGDMGEYRGKRERFEKLMKNELGHRVTEDESNIFRKRNETLGAVRSQIAFKVARTQSDLLGSSPWLAAVPEGNNDVQLSEMVCKHLQWKLNLADARTALEEMVERGFHFGEGIARICWEKTVEQYERQEAVVVQMGPDKKPVPVLTPSGEYLTEKSATQIVQDAEQNERTVFADAPTVEYPNTENGLRWEMWQIEEEQTTYNGLKLEHIDFTAFRCPMGYRFVAESPFRGHVYEMLRSDLREKIAGLHGDDENKWPEAVRALWEQTANDSTTAKTDEKRKLSADTGDEKNPKIKCLDAEILWAPAGDAKARWFFVTVLMDYANHEPLFVEYLANMLPTCRTIHRSLYAVLPVDCLPGQWCGRGEWEKHEDLNNLVDAMWSTMLYRDDMSSNPMSAVDWSAIHERKEEVQFRPGAKVTLKDGRTVADFMGFVTMPNTNFQTNAQLQFILNMNMLETGVTSAARGGVGDMPATNTATGIQSVLASGSTLHLKPTNDLRRGAEILLTNAAAVLYSHQDKEETFAYTEGDATQLLTLSPEQVRDLTLNVTLLMTRARNHDIVEQARAAIGVHGQYIALPEQEKASARWLYQWLLKGLDVPGANEIIREPFPPDPNAGQPNLLDKIRVTYTDLPRVAKAQLLQMMGFDLQPEDIEDTPPAKEKQAESATPAMPADGMQEVAA